MESKMKKNLSEKMKRSLKRIKDRNYRFRKMAPQRQRATIAKDVLALLGSGKILGESGTYLSFDNDLFVDQVERDVQLHELIQRSDQTCTVCGIGSAFVAAVLRADKCTAGDLGYDSNDGFMRKYLKQWFSKEQIELIEVAFEGDEYAFYTGKATKRARRAAEFGRQIADDNQRLKLIFENIVKNNGTFVP